MKLFVIDFEATCQKERDDEFLKQQEIIEWGMSILDGETFDETHGIDLFIRPIFHPTLSQFCTDLTTIKQSQVNAGMLFEDAVEFAKLLVDPHKDIFGSWGDFDKNILKKNCRLNDIPYPFEDNAHINIKQFVAHITHRRPCSIDATLKNLGMKFQGVPHRALTDAVNVSRILRYLSESINDLGKQAKSWATTK